MNAMEKAAGHYGQTLEGFLASVGVLIHGTTLATNTLLTGRGATTGMITTKNFRDMLEIRRGIKPVHIPLYNVFIPPNRPLVPRVRRIGVEERTIYTGEVLTPVNEKEVTEAVAGLKARGTQAVAVCFLHSYANPANELRAAEVIKKVAPDLYVTTSHETIPVWREFERFNTTVVGAYVGPVVARYLAAMERRLKTSGFKGTLLIMLANGLVQTVDQCVDRAVYLLGSGPAAAPSGALHLGGLLGRNNLLSIDMGGTSLDVCLIRQGEIPTSTESWVGDQRIAIKMVDIHSVGAGGGSIARIDSLGLLRVGPESAGADPGPVCYGQGGTEPTVTDADLVLGYVPPDYFLGGQMKLDLELAKKAMKGIGERLKLDPVGVAQAIFTSVNSFMADQIKEVSTKQGHDVREFVLVAGGGAGPVHAAFIADLLKIRTVMIPSVAALYSAFGMFAMDLGRDYARSYVARAASVDLLTMNQLYSAMEREALEAFRAMGVSGGAVTLRRTADLRYIGQFHEVETEMDGGELTRKHIDDTVEAFHRQHESLYAFSMPWKGVELLTLRVKATAPKAPFHLREVQRGDSDASGAFKRRRRCLFGGKETDTPVYDGDKLRAGNLLSGPAIIEEPTTTVVIPEGYRSEVDRFKNYVLTRQGAGRGRES